MHAIPSIIEAAVLLVFVFLLGCVIGWILRAKVFSKRADKTPVAPLTATETAKETAKETIAPPVSKPTIVKSDPISPKPAIVKTEAEKIQAEKPIAKPKVVASQPKAVVTAKAVAPKPKATAPKPKAVATKPRKAVIAKPKSPTQTGKPAALNAPRDGKKDDLKMIKGVGPKLEGILNELGIYHFDQIAQWKRIEIDWVDDFLSFKGRIDRDKWISQANKLK